MDYASRYNWTRVEWLCQLARSPDLSHGAVRVGLLIGTFLVPVKREEINPSYEWIMKNARVRSRSSVSKALKELGEAGFLDIRYRHRYTSVYALPFDEEGNWNGPLKSPKTLSPKNGHIEIRACSSFSNKK